MNRKNKNVLLLMIILPAMFLVTPRTAYSEELSKSNKNMVLSLKRESVDVTGTVIKSEIVTINPEETQFDLGGGDHDTLNSHLGISPLSKDDYSVQSTQTMAIETKTIHIPGPGITSGTIKNFNPFVKMDEKIRIQQKKTKIKSRKINSIKK